MLQLWQVQRKTLLEATKVVFQIWQREVYMERAASLFRSMQ